MTGILSADGVCSQLQIEREDDPIEVVFRVKVYPEGKVYELVGDQARGDFIQERFGKFRMTMLPARLATMDEIITAREQRKAQAVKPVRGKTKKGM